MTKQVWLAYAAACLSVRGCRVDSSWSPDEIQGAWCALPRPSVDVQAWLSAMSSIEALWSEAQSVVNDEFIKSWNTKSDQCQATEASPATEVRKEVVEFKTLDPIRMNGSPDVRAVFDGWADAKKETAYIMFSSDAGVCRKLVPISEIRGV